MVSDSNLGNYTSIEDILFTVAAPGGFPGFLETSQLSLLKVEKATTLPDDCNLVRGHATLTTFTMI